MVVVTSPLENDIDVTTEGKLSFRSHLTDFFLYMRHSVTSFTRAAPRAPCHFTLHTELSFLASFAGHMYTFVECY